MNGFDLALTETLVSTVKNDSELNSLLSPLVGEEISPNKLIKLIASFDELVEAFAGLVGMSEGEFGDWLDSLN